MGIPTRIYLALPREDFIFVLRLRRLDRMWVEEFNTRLVRPRPVRVMGDSKESAGAGFRTNRITTSGNATISGSCTTRSQP